MKTSYLTPAIFLLALCVTSCENENEIKPENVLCDGKSSADSYFPLSVGNYWAYQLSDGRVDTITITGYSVYGNKTYFRAWHKTLSTPRNRYFRYDGDGTVWEYMPGVGESKFMAYKCKNNQDLDNGGSLHYHMIHKVISNVYVECSTLKCNYKSCNKIKLEDGIEKGELYFKKGLGIVFEKVILPNGILEYHLVDAKIN